MPRQRCRLDVLLAERQCAESREKAQRLIYAGKVSVDGRPASKPGVLVGRDARIQVVAARRYVGRGAEKLEHALKQYKIDVTGLVCVDIGASTGGFTDCLLQRGAGRVYAIDVGRGQLAWKLRNDPRVVVMERTNARYLRSADFPRPFRFAAIDVAFISLTKILPAVKDIVCPGAAIVALIKPQFEAGRKQVARGGVVRDPAVHASVVERIRRFAEKELGLEWRGVCESPLKGPAGNIEFLAFCVKP